MIYNRTLTDYEIKILSKNATWKSLTAKSKDQLTPAELTVLKSYFMSVLDTVALKNAAELTALRKIGRHGGAHTGNHGDARIQSA